MSGKSYLSPAQFRIFAHRGTTELGAVENTLQAFSDAIESGADYLETDVQATKDAMVVVFHDEDLSRVLGLNKRVSDLTFAELQSLSRTRGVEIPSLEDAINAFPTARFNIDIKALPAAMGASLVIRSCGAEERVLVSSFSAKRRLLALTEIPSVATSADSTRVLQLLLGLFLGSKSLIGHALRNLDAVQIPTHFGWIRLDRKRLIEECQSHGVEVHYWTINEPSEAKRLRALGANGIVTDRCKLMAKELAE